VRPPKPGVGRRWDLIPVLLAGAWDAGRDEDRRAVAETTGAETKLPAELRVHRQRLRQVAKRIPLRLHRQTQAPKVPATA
jgi:hypothetical protein